MGENGIGGVWDDLVGLSGKIIDYRTAKVSGSPFPTDADARYGIDEYGRLFPRGGSQGLFGSPVVVLGAGILAAALLIYLLKR